MNAVYTDRRSPAAIISLVLMTVSAAVRCVYFSIAPAEPLKLIFQFGLPLASAVLFVAAIVFFGRSRFRLTCVPVTMGVAFFVIKSLGFGDTLHTVLCILLYSLVAALYALTAFGVIRTRIPCLLVFGLPFLYHLFVEDTQYYFFASPPVPFLDWLPEISVLMIMAGLFSITLAMRRR